MSDTETPAVRPSLRLLLEVMLFAVLPAVLFVAFMVDAYHRNILGFDFEHFLITAARDVADGRSPYPRYQYPPLVAFALVPFTFVPGPNIVFAVLLTACVPASMWFLGVRDWRCYGVVFAWAPVLAAIQTSNVTIPLLLGSAICWHYRDRWKIASVSGGLTIAAKLLTAPLVVWFAVTRRLAAATGTCVVAGVVSLVLWAAIGFSGAADYPGNIDDVSRITSQQSYTLKVVLQDIGVAAGPARLGWAALAFAVLIGCVVLGWRGDDRRSFALAVTLMIVGIPIIWLHSFALLIAAVAVMRPRLSAAWLVPLLMVIGPGTGNGRPWQTAGVLGLMVLTLVLAFLPSLRQPQRRETISTELASDISAA